MRRFLAVFAVAGCLWAAGPSAQDAPAPRQTFRAGVDVIRIDVTVLDKNRAPVRGLKAADFAIRENGQPQRVVAIAEVDGALADPTPSAWMRYAPRDVANNNLADQVGDGQAIAIVLDDFSIPQDSVDMAVSTRDIGHYIVNSLGPSDLAAVVFPFKPGRTEDFTHDRAKLVAAVDKFEAEQPRFRMLQPERPGPIVGDMQRYSPALGRDPCFQLQPVIPTLRAVTSRLATVPQRRKALFFVSVGLDFTFTPGRSRCQAMLYDELKRTFEMAQRFNVNIHAIDPAGAAGYRRFLEQPRVDIRNVGRAGGLDPARASSVARVRHDFLEILGEETGGRPIVETDDLESAIAEVFHEYSSYYLIGYETTNGRPDGKFRKLEVSVKGRDLDVHTRKGRWAPDSDGVVTDEGLHTTECVLDCWYVPPRQSDLQLAGLSPYQPLSLRAVVYPLARAKTTSTGTTGNVEVAAALSVRLPAVLRAAEETLTVVRTTYDADERASPPVKETFTRSVAPAGGDETTYDVLSRFSLSPGRHEVRFSASSRVADASGSVIVEIVVPDLSVNGAAAIVLGAPRTEAPETPISSLVPIVPTTARDFAQGDHVTALLRVFANPSVPFRPVEMSINILRADSIPALEIPPSVIPAEAFDKDGSADFQLDLPLSKLKSGLHLLSITARFDDARTTRRDLVFRVR